MHGIELCFDNFRDVVKYAPLLERKCNAVDGVLLHVLTHVARLHHRVLCLLLVEIPMRLHNVLFVSKRLPLICFFYARV